MNRINYAQTVDNEMEMPTYCQHCCEIFDLNDGRCSEKWYPNVIICENCWNVEREEIEEGGRWEDINIDISNALYDIENLYRDWETDRKSTRLNSSHITRSRMPSSA